MPPPSVPAMGIPSRVVSLYTMLTMYAHSFCRASGIIGQFRTLVSCGASPNKQAYGALSSEMYDLKIQCKTLELTNTLAQINRINQLIASAEFTHQQVTDAVTEVYTRLVDELESRTFYALPLGKIDYVTGNKFQPSVGERFPDAIEDMTEAARCYAFERPTACIFHLMRVTEYAIQEIGLMLGMDDHNPTWEPIIRRIDAELKADYKKREFQGSQDLLANLSAHLQAVKVAWRNKTMHVEKVNTMEHAKEIYDATCGLMRYISENLPAREKKMGIVRSIRDTLKGGK
jgi:hypothetical protein